MYSLAARPLIFRLPPEGAHKIAETALGVPGIWNALRLSNGAGSELLKTDLAGIELPTPVGLAAGFDKDCKVLGSVLNLGFGFTTGGTVTLASRPGNPKPRMVRLPEQKAVMNSMGFPGQGLEPAIKRLKKSQKYKSRVLVSIAGTIEDEIFECLRRTQSLVSGIELNISSPNTAGLKIFHEPARLRSLIEGLVSEKQVPLFVKLPPWPRDDENRREILKLAATAVDAGVDGLVVANTHPIESSRLQVGRGGLSGAPLFEHTELMIADIQAQVQGQAAIIACGGVSTAEQVWKLLATGASAVQLYTSFIYEGPGLPARINKRLAKLMTAAGITNVSEISGAPPEIK
ncbi:MAG: dihydroorotate dehydrogenase (quinone) [Chloroflexi bacterium]|nr:dihydroorotate dehydrogenase (quinone) [Chloroflexota bacterium]MBT5626693.1 dihydroorotate dehydrogenase (quinone) [Chloroflexota bacterium]